MQQIKNVWIQMKKREIEAVKRQLLEYDYAGSYGGAINLMQVNNLLDGCVVEIVKLQKENDDLKAELKKFTETETLDAKEPQSKSEAKRLKIQTDSKNET